MLYSKTNNDNIDVSESFEIFYNKYKEENENKDNIVLDRDIKYNKSLFSTYTFTENIINTYLSNNINIFDEPFLEFINIFNSNINKIFIKNIILDFYNKKLICNYCDDTYRIL